MFRWLRRHVLWCDLMLCYVVWCVVLYCTVLYCNMLWCDAIYCLKLLYSMHIPFWRDTFHPISSIPFCWYAMMPHSMTFCTRLSHAFKLTPSISMSPLGRVQHFLSCLSMYGIDSFLLAFFSSPFSYLSTTSSLPLHYFFIPSSFFSFPELGKAFKACVISGR